MKPASALPAIAESTPMARPSKARTPKQTDGIAAANVDHEALQQAGADAALLGQHIALVESAYGDNYPFDLYRLEARARDLKTIIAGAAWELGCIFVRIRAQVEQGEFHASLQRMGYAPRWAQMCMRSVQKFSGSPQRQQLAQQLSQSKLLELLSEDDETLDALEDGGTLAGLTLDKIDRMSVRELKATLRTEREKRADEAETSETKLAESQARIDKLLGRSKRTGVEDKASELLAEAMKDYVGAAMHLRNFSMTIEQIDQHYADHELQVSEDIQAVIDEKVQQVEGFLTDFLAKFGA